MAAFLSDLTLIADFVFQIIFAIWGIMQDQPILLVSVGLWVLRKVFDVFGLIKG